MSYVEIVKKLVEGEVSCASGYQHGLADIVREVNSKGVCYREFSIMNNIYFLDIDEFKNDWVGELNRFCNYFNLKFKINEGGTKFKFGRSV